MYTSLTFFQAFSMLWKWSVCLTANSLGKTGRATQAGAIGEKKALVWLTSSTAVEKKKHYWYFNNCLRYSKIEVSGSDFPSGPQGFILKTTLENHIWSSLSHSWSLFFVGRTFFCHANASYLCFFGCQVATKNVHGLLASGTRCNQLQGLSWKGENFGRNWGRNGTFQLIFLLISKNHPPPAGLGGGEENHEIRLRLEAKIGEGRLLHYTNKTFVSATVVIAAALCTTTKKPDGLVYLDMSPKCVLRFNPFSWGEGRQCDNSLLWPVNRSPP